MTLPHTAYAAFIAFVLATARLDHLRHAWICATRDNEAPPNSNLLSLATENNGHQVDLTQTDFDDFDLLRPRACETFHSRYDPENAEASLSEELRVLHVDLVVHLLGYPNTSTYDIPMSVVMDQIDVLNEDFRALVGTPGAPGSDSRVEFALASEDAEASPTNGVLRYRVEEWFDNEMSTIGAMELLAWDKRRYANLFVTDFGTPQPIAAQIPSGAYMDTRMFGREPTEWEVNRGRTASHEFGHYFGLRHVFQNGCDEPGDGIPDTEPQANQRYGCPAGAQSCGTPDPIHNYMGYTDDLCMSEFTPMQINRMRCDILERRFELLALTEPPFFEANFEFTQDEAGAASVAFRDLSAGVVGNGSAVSIWSWNFGDNGTSALRDPMHTYERNGTYSATLTLFDHAQGDRMSNYTAEIVVTKAGELPNSAPARAFLQTISFSVCVAYILSRAN